MGRSNIFEIYTEPYSVYIDLELPATPNTLVYAFGISDYVVIRADVAAVSHPGLTVTTALLVDDAFDALILYLQLSTL